MGWSGGYTFGAYADLLQLASAVMFISAERQFKTPTPKSTLLYLHLVNLDPGRIRYILACTGCLSYFLE